MREVIVGTWARWRDTDGVSAVSTTTNMYMFERLTIKSSKTDLSHQCNSNQNLSLLIEVGKMITKCIWKLNITSLRKSFEKEENWKTHLTYAIWFEELLFAILIKTAWCWCNIKHMKQSRGYRNRFTHIWSIDYQ